MSRTLVRSLSVLTAVALVAGLCLAAAAPSEKDLDKVKIGMTRDQVLKLLGKPKRDEEVSDNSELCRLFVYKKVGRYKVVNVWFDCDDKVKAIDKAK